MDTCLHFISKFCEHVLKIDFVRSYLSFQVFVEQTLGPSGVSMFKKNILVGDNEKYTYEI